MRVLIPAYEPGPQLLQLVKDVQTNCAMEIVIVDDGSGQACTTIFERAESLGCRVLHHPCNRGKGAALKTGFQYLMASGEADGVVSADCDGQHTVDDICRVAAQTSKDHRSMVLGIRQFAGKVPLRSRFGNSVTRAVFSVCAGYRIHDTQTGLRGYPSTMLPWLCQVEGSRFEYEMNMLLELKPAGYSVKEITIKTIYENGNKTSHFRPLADSLLIYLPIVKFTASSLSSAILDFVLLFLFQGVLKQLFFAVALSRGISSVFNYCCNKYLVFHGQQKGQEAAPRYFMLVTANMLLNYVVLNTLVMLRLPLTLAKILTEMTLFLFSYVAQKKLVFVSRRSNDKHGPIPGHAS